MFRSSPTAAVLAAFTLAMGALAMGARPAQAQTAARAAARGSAAPAARLQPAITDAPLAAWATAFALNLEAPPSQAPATVLQLERQTFLDGAASAFEVRLAIRIDSPQGLPLATVEIPDVAPYQTVQLNEARLLRGGKEVARLKAQDFQLAPVNHAPGLEAPDVYWTGTARFEGVQVGDVISLGYTLTGASPDLNRRAARIYLKEFPSSTLSPRRFVQRIAWPATRSVLMQRSRDAPQMAPREAGALRELVMDMSPAEVAASEPSAPPEDVRPPFVDVSEFASWAETAQAVRALTEPELELGTAAAGIAAEIRAKSADPAARVVMALRKVQDEVSYYELGLATGGYRPRPPDETWRRRSGDCKDKAVLFVAVLRALGIKADPALVQVVSDQLSSDNVSPRESAPSAIPFNHEIARVELGGKVYWLDPTRQLQRGPLDAIDQFDDGWALTLAPGVSDLERIAPPVPAEPMTTQEMVFDFASTPGQLTVNVKRTERGASADLARTVLALHQQQLYDAYYSTGHMGTIGQDWTVKPVTVQDDATGEVTTTAAQTIESPFQAFRLAGQDIDLFYDTARLAQHVPIVGFPDRPRTLPIRVFRRYSYAERIEVDLPSDPKYELVFEPQHIETQGFAFNSKVQALGPRKALLTYAIRAKAGEVPPEDEAAEYKAMVKVVNTSPVIVMRRR